MSRSLELAQPKSLSVDVAQAPIASPVFVLGPKPLRTEVRGAAWFGFAVVAVFFGLLGGWASQAPLSGAVVASGIINPEGSRRTVQHLEGGILRQIAVADGTAVAKGDLLFVLEDVNVRSELSAMRNRYITLVAKEARLNAERGKATAFTYDLKDPRFEGSEDVARATFEQQANEFNQRRSGLETRALLLEQRVAQVNEQIVGFQRQLAGVQRQRGLFKEEIAAVSEMVNKGLERRPRLLSLQRSDAELTGTEGALIASVARSREAIAETKLQIEATYAQRREEIERDLSEARDQRAALEEQLKGYRDRLTRTSVYAPVSGVVINLKFKTLGGVVRPGEQVLDIVPSEDNLVIDARISTRDIDEVQAGQAATVIFPSVPQRNTQRIPGEVMQVSADVITDTRSGAPYFLAKVSVDRAEVARVLPQLRLVAGMPADVFIATTERTVLEYLLQPVTQTLQRAFRES
ncbi:MAG: HlyD family type I secretion periplasmic adaptor subunit [Alphaproteobacteria bacterium]